MRLRAHGCALVLQIALTLLLLISNSAPGEGGLTEQKERALNLLSESFPDNRHKV